MDDKTKIIAVDFDGTLCEDRFPHIGEPNIGLIRVLKYAKENQKIKLILWTCRCDLELESAVQWCEQQGLTFDTVNENLPEVIANFGGDTRKIVADLYLDDKALFPICSKSQYKELVLLKKEDEFLTNFILKTAVHYNDFYALHIMETLKGIL